MFGKKITSPPTAKTITVVSDVLKVIPVDNIEKLIKVVGISQDR
jgi:hypothetical protein